ncbi:MAG: GatB/YqeY domain-containing protein [Mariprofundaceae bacterium]|nr:GatB/YqeY domain-containing protein [Mariprofundaceae bacterium]
MMLIETITDDMKAAMKAGDKARLAAIRMLRAAIKDKEIELGHALEENEVLAVLARLVKQRRDAARQYAGAGRADLEAKEMAEVEIFQAYMPAQLSDDEMAAVVDKAIADTGAVGMRDMGRVMATVKAEAESRADMGKLSALVRERLQNG